jgi:hypothetical protein
VQVGTIVTDQVGEKLIDCGVQGGEFALAGVENRSGRGPSASRRVGRVDGGDQLRAMSQGQNDLAVSCLAEPPVTAFVERIIDGDDEAAEFVRLDGESHKIARNVMR